MLNDELFWHGGTLILQETSVRMENINKTENLIRRMKKGGNINIGIIGGGRGCKMILKCVDSGRLNWSVLGVADVNHNAPGYLQAKKKRIYTTKHYQNLYTLQGLEILIEITGHSNVEEEIRKTRPEHIEVLGHREIRELLPGVPDYEKERIDKEKELYKKFFEHHPVASYIRNEKTKEVLVNGALIQLTGYAKEELEQMDISDLFAGSCREDLDLIYQLIVQGREIPEWYELSLITKDGNYRTVSLTCSYSKPGDVYRHVTIIDRTRDKEYEQKLEDDAVVDRLTHLYNRRKLEADMTKLVKGIKRREADAADRRKPNLSVLVIDVDNFKNYNDSYGHLRGDKVLMKLGEVLMNNIRTPATAYRYGGEEFVVTLPDTSLEEACVVAERLRVKFASVQFTPQDGQVVSKTLSIGVASYVTGDDKDSLLEKADKFMYIAKKSNNCVYAGP